MNLGAMYGRSTERPIVDTATTNAISMNLERRCVVVTSPSVHCVVEDLTQHPYIASSKIMSFDYLNDPFGKFRKNKKRTNEDSEYIAK
jgi:hypothetical protein